MGDIADAAKKIGISKDYAKALEDISNLTGIAANVFGAYQAGAALLNWRKGADSPPSTQDLKDELDHIEKKLDGLLTTLEDEILGVGHELIRVEVTDKLGDSRTALAEAISYVRHPTDPQQMSAFSDAISRSLSAATKLAPYGYWTQVNSPRVFYSDVWNGTILPPDHSLSINQVFDYRYPLPAYLEAITDRVFVLSVADASFREQIVAEVKDYVQQLSQIYNKILSAFQVLRTPDSNEFRRVLGCIAPNMFLTLIDRNIVGPSRSFDDGNWIYVGDDKRGSLLNDRIPGGKWVLSNFVYGVVEGYTGTESAAAYAPAYLQRFSGSVKLPDVATISLAIKDGIILSGAELEPTFMYGEDEFLAQWRQFLLDVALESRYLAFSLYTGDSGLSKLRLTITTLCAMIAQEPPSIPTNLVSSTELSLRGARDAFVGFGYVASGAPLSLRYMAELRNIVTKFNLLSLRSLFAPPGTFGTG